MSSEELEAIGLGDLAALDERSRAAVVYASALAEGRSRRPIAPEIAAAAAEHLSVEVAARARTSHASALTGRSRVPQPEDIADAVVEALQTGRYEV